MKNLTAWQQWIVATNLLILLIFIVVATMDSTSSHGGRGMSSEMVAGIIFRLSSAKSVSSAAICDSDLGLDLTR